MARPPSQGERPLYWVGSSKRDLLSFPDAVRDEFGTALSVVQFGGKPRSAKPWKGEGPGVFELVDYDSGGTYRAIYTVRFQHAVYVLHAFQKKSPSGIRTAQHDVDLISARLKLATNDYKERHEDKS